jgi:hypothetical protein
LLCYDSIQILNLNTLLIYTDSIDTFVKFRNSDLIILQQYFKCLTMVASGIGTGSVLCCG